jgi:hypothetical protein
MFGDNVGDEGAGGAATVWTRSRAGSDTGAWSTPCDVTAAERSVRHSIEAINEARTARQTSDRA